jgi:hypothetical protein
MMRRTIPYSTLWAATFAVIGLMQITACVGEGTEVPLDVAVSTVTPNDDPPRTFLRGDANGDGIVALADSHYLVNWLHQNGPRSECEDAADANDDGVVDQSDIIYLLNYFYFGGEAPPAPFPAPGVDSSPDRLNCSGDVLSVDSPVRDSYAVNQKSCDDEDGDGMPENTNLDRDGRPYCLSIEFGSATVGKDLKVRVTAYHADSV